MAHFAQVTDNIVRNVIVIDNSDCVGGDFPDSDSVGQAFIAFMGIEGTWLQTSYNGNFRGQYAGQGMTYDPVLDQFISPQTEEPLSE